MFGVVLYPSCLERVELSCGIVERSTVRWGNMAQCEHKISQIPAEIPALPL
ncbi:hypothetical protein KR51_00019710 [Rubidibacter lacunae KORDI 51-2]|uniref:Uncharacterized protein n=1 Tax=Rubidibacter lacunae KORDI 51-2 TaxID=582515 RepID=U5DKG0_9CHRO|nr:hypothetical protein KR51_00019710 [Rubidibacter lacunae KORDI 51-2]